jgi:hypothetical protein
MWIYQVIFRVLHGWGHTHVYLSQGGTEEVCEGCGTRARDWPCLVGLLLPGCHVEHRGGRTLRDPEDLVRYVEVLVR